MRLLRIGLVLAAALAGVAAAALVSAAIAKTFTLKVGKHATVTNTRGVTRKEGIAVSSKGFAVYTLTGDSRRHQECVKRNGCFALWPPVKVSSVKKLSKAPGIKGKLGKLRRDGFVQVTLGGHPLYTYAADIHRGKATGEGIKSFGGIWHVVKVRGSSSSSSSTTTTMSTSTGMTSTTTTTSTSTGMTSTTTSSTTTNPYGY
jgi:predicted lipoprotein with Yx(FWY)xxD motif